VRSELASAATTGGGGRSAPDPDTYKARDARWADPDPDTYNTETLAALAGLFSDEELVR